MGGRRACFLSINVNNVPAVAPRHLLSHLARMCPNHAQQFQIVDVAKDDTRVLEQLHARLTGHPPALLAATAFVWNLAPLKAVAEVLRVHSPDAIIFIGGPAADSFFGLYPDLVDIAAVGEGESFFAHVASVFLEQGREALVDSAYWRACVETKSEWPVDLDVSQGLVPEGYIHRESMVYVETSRGCPFHCAYCESAATRLRHHPLEVVRGELRYFREQGVRLVYFVDPSFLLRFERALAILHTCRELGLRAEMEINLDVLKDNQIEELLRFENLVLSLGIQSWNPEVLVRATRRTDLKQLERNLEVLRAHRFGGGRVDFYPHLIVGLPGDSLEGFKRSVIKTLEYRPSSIFLSHLQILPHSRFGQAPGAHDITHDPEPPFLVRSSVGFSANDIALAHAFCDALSAWDNTYGLDALYVLSDYLGMTVAETYSLVQDAAGSRSWLCSESGLRFFCDGVEEELARCLGEDGGSLADYLRHCRLRYTKVHDATAARPTEVSPVLSAGDRVTLNRSARLAVVEHQFSDAGPSNMSRLDGPIVCLAYGRRIWKVPWEPVGWLIHGHLSERGLDYRELLVLAGTPEGQDQATLLCSDLIRWGAMYLERTTS